MAASVLKSSLNGGSLPNVYSSKSKSKLLYDCRFTANQFVLAPSPLRITTRFFFSTETFWSYSLCNILSEEKMGVSYEYAWPFVKCTFRTYSMLLEILSFALCTSPQSVKALQSRSCLSHVSYATTAA
jgi:hypothetical protein